MEYCPFPYKVCGRIEAVRAEQNATAATAAMTAPITGGGILEPFEPKRVFFEQRALEYPLGTRLYGRFEKLGTPIFIIASHNRVTGIPGGTPQIAYREAKRTLVIGVKVGLDFDTCRPSADFEVAMSTSCPGGCQYCYLATTLGRKPYIRVYVNTDEILSSVDRHIQDRMPEITTFEMSSTSDPLAVEHLTGNLAKAIEFMGKRENGRLRFVTKFHFVDSLLNVEHKGHTRFRFSLNSVHVINSYEQHTSSMEERLEAAGKVRRAGYPLGFILAPLFVYPGWKSGYADMLERLADSLSPAPDDLTFELIMHRFTRTAKRVILERFPHTSLDLAEEGRAYKWGKYGRGKYVYPREQAGELEEYIRQEISRRFPKARIEYFT